MRALAPAVVSVTLVLGACIPGELAVASLDASAPGDGSLVDRHVTGDGGSMGEGEGGDASMVMDATLVCDACAQAVPAGWSPVEFALSRASACPSGLTAVDLIENPTPTAGSCTCACNVSTQPDCQNGTITTTFDNGGGTCGLAGMSVLANGGQCTAMPGTLGKDSAARAPPPQGGSCMASATPNPASVTSRGDRVCTGGPSCAACASLAGFTPCILAMGDQPCPAGYATKHLVGTAPTLSCGSCGCAVMAACSGTLVFFMDTNCSVPVFMEPGNGACQAAGGKSFNSYQWTGVPQSVACTPGTSAPAVTLAGEQTICCP